MPEAANMAEMAQKMMSIGIMNRPRTRQLMPVACILILVLLISSLSFQMDAVSKLNSLGPSGGKFPSSAFPSKKKVGRKGEAYVTFLAPRRKEEKNPIDRYYNSTRILVYQLLHDPDARDLTRDVVVLSTPGVDEWKKEQLAKDGAIIRDVEDVKVNLSISIDRYRDVNTKLAAWTLVEYSRVMFLDADVFPLKPLTEIWKLKTSQVRPVKEVGSFAYKSPEEAKVEGDVRAEISSYVFSASYDDGLNKADNYFNSGVFMLSPSQKMFERLIRLIPYSDLYGGTTWPDQNILNWVFRSNGPMPYGSMPQEKIARVTTEEKIKKGLLIIHDKYWHVTGFLKEKTDKMVHRMEGFYNCRYGI